MQNSESSGCVDPESLLNLKRKRVSAIYEENSSPRRASKRPSLLILIPDNKPDLTIDAHYSATETSERKSTDSLFSSVSDKDSLFDETTPEVAFSPTAGTSSSLPDYRTPAWRTTPPIPGLFFDPSVRLPDELADCVAQYCLQTYFSSPNVNQVMLFGRAPSSSNPSSPKNSTPPPPTHGHAGIPPPLINLLSTLSELLRPILPSYIYELIFPRNPTRARQAIINLYQPGEGITAHVDLLRRFGDGIVGVSLLGGCVMQFVKQSPHAELASDCVTSSSSSGDSEGTRVDDQEGSRSIYDVYLAPGSAIVMSGDARFNWTHGIDKRKRDLVMDLDGDEKNARWLERSVRLSITFRWLLPGADVVGGDS